jgi:hypothetical protein
MGVSSGQRTEHASAVLFPAAPNRGEAPRENAASVGNMLAGIGRQKRCGRVQIVWRSNRQGGDEGGVVSERQNR